METSTAGRLRGYIEGSCHVRSFDRMDLKLRIGIDGSR